MNDTDNTTTIYLPMPIGERVILRCRDAGVHYGTLLGPCGDRIALSDSRRIWYYSGSASLSEMAVYGPSRPGECKFGCRLSRVDIRASDVCEVIVCAVAGAVAIEAVPEWRIGVTP